MSRFAAAEWIIWNDSSNPKSITKRAVTPEISRCIARVMSRYTANLGLEDLAPILDAYETLELQRLREDIRDAIAAINEGWELHRILAILTEAVEGPSNRPLSMDEKLNAILYQLRKLNQKGGIMSAELDALKAAVENDATVEASAITLINGLAAQIKAAGTDPAALKAITDHLDTNASALAAAVAANTTPAPAPATPPATSTPTA